MKKISVFIFIPFILFALELKYFTYDDALQKAKKDNKIVMVEFMRQGCHYCVEMENSVLRDKEVVKKIEKYFIPVKIDINKDEIPLNMKIYMTPTFVFIDKNEKIVKKIPGAWKKEDFLMILDEVRNRNDK